MAVFCFAWYTSCMQVTKLHKKIDVLQHVHGAKHLNAIYGAGCIKNPNAMFIFMNPTGKNVSAQKTWGGLRAPWIGTKNIWRLFYQLHLISDVLFEKIQKLQAKDWTTEFAQEVYNEISAHNVYITNLAKCTQIDARPLKNTVFKEYLETIYEEIGIIQPTHILTLGNQVSSILLEKPIRVSSYTKNQKEILKVKTKNFDVYPVYYPVGQGMRNMPLAIKRIQSVIK